MARVRGTQIYSPEVLEELKKAMEETPRAGMDDELTFKQQMNALQRFLNHGMSRFSLETWYHTLSALFHTYQQHHSNSYQGDQTLTKITAVSQLRTISRDVILQREGGSMRESDAHGLKYLENFLAALQCLKEAKACIDSVFKYLYYNYYDPDAVQSKEGTLINSAKPRREGNHVITGTDVKDMQMDPSSFGILTLEQMTGSTEHKLRRTVKDMKEIISRWGRLLSEDEILLGDLDPESQQDVHLLQGISSFEHVLRLLPDIFAKYYKCLELAKQWWVLAHEIYPELPICREPTPEPVPSEQGSEAHAGDPDTTSPTDQQTVRSSFNQETESKGSVSSEQLEAVVEEIQKREELLESLHGELELLEERERHFDSLVETYENVTAQLDTKVREKKALVAARERQFQGEKSLEKDSEGGVEHHRRFSVATSNGLDVQIDRSEREVQMLQFQQTLLLQDYMVQLEVRPSIIRFAEDLKLRIQDARQGLNEQMQEKSRLEGLLQNGEEDSKQNDGDDVNEADQTSSQVDDDDDNDDDGDSDDASPPPPPAKKPAASKSAEKRMELSRLHARPMREDTSASSVKKTASGAAATTAESSAALKDSSTALSSGTSKKAAAVTPRDPKRRMSVPVGRKDLKTVPHNTDPQTSSNTKTPLSKPTRDGPKTVSKPLRVPPIPAPGSTHKEQNQSTTHSNTDKTENQPQTETLFQRRARRKQAKESPSPNRGGNAQENDANKGEQQQQPMRPRAKSDPHTTKPESKTARKDSRVLRRQKTSDSDKIEHQKPKPDHGGNSGNTASKPKPAVRTSQHNGDQTLRKKQSYTNV